MSDVIDEHAKEAPSSLRTLEKALRDVLVDPTAMDILRKDLK